MKGGFGTYGCGGSADPGGENADTRGEDVDDRSEVAERSHPVGGIGSTDSESSWLRSWGGVGGILSLVSSSDSQEETSRDGAGSGGVDGSGLGASERHVGNSALGAAASLLVVCCEVDTAFYQ